MYLRVQRIKPLDALGSIKVFQMTNSGIYAGKPEMPGKTDFSPILSNSGLLFMLNCGHVFSSVDTRGICKFLTTALKTTVLNS